VSVSFLLLFIILIIFPTAGSGYPITASDNEIGAAEVFKSKVVTTIEMAAAPEPAWLAEFRRTMLGRMDQIEANLTAQITDVRNAVTNIQNDLPVKIANSARGANGRLRRPNAAAQGFPPLLAAPNPRTRDELVALTGK
jgi:hypothetical protein